MTPPSLEAIQKRHEELLNQSAMLSNDDHLQVRAFLDTLAQTGLSIQSPQQRSLLRSLIRYWSSFINDRTGEFPVVRLQPFSEFKSIVEKPIIRGERQDLARNEEVQVKLEKPSVFLAPPRPPDDLVGRKDLLLELKNRLFEDKGLALSALSGLPGVGKTTLAVALAHNEEVLAHFPDGVLWARLGRHPDVLAQLGMWGIALGISSNEMGNLASIKARAQAVRAAIGMRKILLVADDVWEIETALNLNVGGYNCAYLITTRSPEIAFRLAGEKTMIVHELNEEDGLALLARLAPRVVETEPGEARDLVRVVGGLPLALTLIGNYLRIETYSGQPRRLHAALIKLRKAEERLMLIEPQGVLEYHPSLPEGIPLSLLTVIGMSDEMLDEASRQTLRALSIFPPKPNTFSEEAARVVAATPVETLDILVDFGLLEGSGPGRYTLHQTIADYARIKRSDTMTEERLIEYFVSYVEANETDYRALELEISNILTALQVAVEKKEQAVLVQGINALFGFLETRGLFDQAEIYLKHALQAAESLDDSIGLMTVLLNLGRIAEKRGDYERAETYLQKGLALARQFGRLDKISALLQTLGWVASNRGEYEQAKTYWQESLAFARELGNLERVCRLLQNLGAIAEKRGDYGQAEVYLQEGLALAQQLGLRERISELLQTLGWVASDRGDYMQAEAYWQEGLALARQLENLERISALLTSLGTVADNRGDYMQAETYLQEGLALARQIGHRERITRLLVNLGVLAENRGDYMQAEAYLQEGLALARQIGHRKRISNALNELGGLHIKQKLLDMASTEFVEALELAQEFANQEYVATARYGLARVAAAMGTNKQALVQGQESLAIFEAIGHGKASEVRQWLATLHPGNGGEENKEK